MSHHGHDLQAGAIKLFEADPRPRGTHTLEDLSQHHPIDHLGTVEYNKPLSKHTSQLQDGFRLADPLPTPKDPHLRPLNPRDQPPPAPLSLGRDTYPVPLAHILKPVLPRRVHDLHVDLLVVEVVAQLHQPQIVVEVGDLVRQEGLDYRFEVQALQELERECGL